MDDELQLALALSKSLDQTKRNTNEHPSKPVTVRPLATITASEVAVVSSGDDQLAIAIALSKVALITEIYNLIFHAYENTYTHAKLNTFRRRPHSKSCQRQKKIPFRTTNN